MAFVIIVTESIEFISCLNFKSILLEKGASTLLFVSVIFFDESWNTNLSSALVLFVNVLNK